MTKTLLLALPCAALIIAGACTQTPAPPPAPAAPAKTPVQRGAYIVAAGGCHDCHTPWKMGANGQPEPDMTLALSGHPEAMKMGPPPKVDPASGWLWGGSASNTAFYGPWGISYAANLTSDQNTGLGIWTEDMFIRAIREGKHMGTSRPILPPMPWHVFRNYDDDDLKAIFAYLKTVKAVANHVPDPVIVEAPPK